MAHLKGVRIVEANEISQGTAIVMIRQQLTK